MRIDIFWASNCEHRTLQSPSRLATSYLVAARTITHISTLDTAADKRAISASHSGLRTTAHDAMRQTPGRCRRIQTACLFDAASQRSVREPHTFLPCYHLSGVCSTLSLTVAECNIRRLALRPPAGPKSNALNSSARMVPEISRQ